VALGLARMVGVRFPSWGPHFQTLAASIIILNLCIGPPLFRSAILSIGEGKRELHLNGKPDHSSPAVPAWHHEARHQHQDGRAEVRKSDQGARSQVSQDV
jgi:hypothetical protein